MARNFKQISSFAIGTLGSRVLGLLRDILIYTTLGLSSWNAAFVLAFSLPNLFRRMVGEGALTSAFVPTFSLIKEQRSEEEAWAFFNLFLRRLRNYLSIAVLLVTLSLLILYTLIDWKTERFEQGVWLSAWLFPYLLLVSLSAITGAVLQVYRKFFVSSLSPVWLNLGMITMLGGASYLLSEDPATRVYFLCGGVMIGGLFQMLIPQWYLRSIQKKPNTSQTVNQQDWSHFVGLFLPAVGGAAILQINILISRLFAFSLDDSAISILYLANRLVEFPLGVFGIAISTVTFPLLAKHFANQDTTNFTQEMKSGYSQILWISLPSMIGLQLMGEDVLRLAFQWGAFEANDLSLTLPSLWILCGSIPFYAMATYLTRVLHAQHNTKSPVKIAGIALVTNLIVSPSFMYFWQVEGLAAANLVTAMLQWYLLRQVLISQKTWQCPPASFFIRILVGLVVLTLIVWTGKQGIHALAMSEKVNSLLSLALIPIAAGSYLVLTKKLVHK